MPKELNLSTNERIDFDDLKYGTSTFSVDSLRSNIVRLVSGGYRGGFVLEGFRVEVPYDVAGWVRDRLQRNRSRPSGSAYYK